VAELNRKLDTLIQAESQSAASTSVEAPAAAQDKQ
jgi:hypothetical protein